MRIKPIEWVDNYRAFIGNISDAAAENWREVIRANVEHPMAAEVNQAVANLCIAWVGRSPESKRRKPEVMEIIEAVLDVRNPGDDTMRGVSPHVNFFDHDRRLITSGIDSMCRRLLHAADPDDAWAIICQPMNVEHSRALEAYAVKNHVEFRRFIPRSAYRDFNPNREGKRHAYTDGNGIRGEVHRLATQGA